IAHAPGLVLADEPTAALDPETAHNVFQLFFSLAKELNLAVLLVSHDWDSLSQFAIPRLQAKLEPGLSIFVGEVADPCSYTYFVWLGPTCALTGTSRFAWLQTWWP